MGYWEQLFSKVENSGIFTIDEVSAGEIGNAATNSNLAFFHLNLAGVAGKPAFMKAAARAFDFPGYFGANWDAFEDCLTDFSWHQAEGYASLIENAEDFADRAPAEMEMACSIFRDAADYWKGKSIRFFVVLTARHREATNSSRDRLLP